MTIVIREMEQARTLLSIGNREARNDRWKLEEFDRGNESRDEEKGDSFAEERETREKGMTLPWRIFRIDSTGEHVQRRAPRLTGSKRRDFFVNQQFSRVSGSPLPPSRPSLGDGLLCL